MDALFDEKEQEYRRRYTEEQGSFDLLAFRNTLENYVNSRSDEICIRTGNPEELEAFAGDRIRVLYDEGIHEGIRISYRDTVYDFSL